MTMQSFLLFISCSLISIYYRFLNIVGLNVKYRYKNKIALLYCHSLTNIDRELVKILSKYLILIVVTNNDYYSDNVYKLNNIYYLNYDTDIFENIDRIIADNDNNSISVLILNRTVTINQNRTELLKITFDLLKDTYMKTSSLARQILPMMINEKFGKIVFIDSRDSSQSDSDSDLTLLRNTGTFSSRTLRELERENINVFYVNELLSTKCIKRNIEDNLFRPNSSSYFGTFRNNWKSLINKFTTK